MSFKKKLSIFEYLDLIQFLKDYFELRKTDDPGFTYTQWGNELGLGSKTILRFILQRKRRVSERTALVVRSHLRLDEQESSYFDFLLSYTQPKSDAERSAAGAQLIRLQRLQYKQEVINPEDSTRDVLSPIVLTLLTFKDFKGTVQKISHYLNISEARAQGVIDGLLKAQLISLKDGYYILESNAFKIPSVPHLESLKAYHEYWLERSKDAIQLDFKTRRFRSLKFALTEEEFSQALERIEEFAGTILNRFDNSNLVGRRLYMIENVIFPLTETYK